jgi:hypothetical protein
MVLTGVIGHRTYRYYLDNLYIECHLNFNGVSPFLVCVASS